MISKLDKKKKYATADLVEVCNTLIEHVNALCWRARGGSLSQEVADDIARALYESKEA